MSESRRFGRAVVIVRTVTVECPFCGVRLDSGGRFELDIGAPAPIHTEDCHVTAGAKRCPNCWQYFEVPDLSTAFVRVLHRRRG